jgi:hypothetical protein
MRSTLFPGIESVFAGRPQHVERWRIACAAVHWELAWRHEPTTIAVSYRGRQSPVVRILQISPRRRAHGRAVRPMSCRGPTLKSREAIWVSRKRLGKDLDRDFALQPRVARAIHLPCRLRRWRKRSRTARVECLDFGTRRIPSRAQYVSLPGRIAPILRKAKFLKLSVFNNRRWQESHLSAESQAVRRRELRNSSKMASQKSERTAAELSRCRPPKLQIMMVASPRNQPYTHK